MNRTLLFCLIPFFLSACKEDQQDNDKAFNNLSIKICTSDQVQLEWNSEVPSIAGVSFSDETLGKCQTEEFKKEHSHIYIKDHCLSDLLAVTTTGPSLQREESDLKLYLLAQTEEGTLTQTERIFNPAKRNCVCKETSIDTSNVCSINNCLEGLNLDTNEQVSGSLGDIYISISEDENGYLKTASIEAPQGIKVLSEEAYLCDIGDINEEDAEDMLTSIPYMDGRELLLKRRTTVLLVKSSKGQLYKVLFHDPSPNTYSHEGLLAAGARFDWIIQDQD